MPHVVLLSSVGAHLPSGTGPIASVHWAEADFRAAGVVTTAVRAAYFQENWALGFAALGQGILPTFVPKTVRFSQVATADIGRVAAAALVEGPVAGASSVIELSGPRDYTAEDAAAAVGSALGKPITAQDAPFDAVVPTLTSMGLQPTTAALYRELYEVVASGHIAPEAASARHVRGSTELAETLAKLVSA